MQTIVSTYKYCIDKFAILKYNKEKRQTGGVSIGLNIRESA